MAAIKKDVTIKVILDLCFVFIMFLPSIICKFAITPFKRGFFCDDESISHPYLDDTISFATVVVVGLSLPAIVIILSEVFLFLYRKKRADISSARPQSNYVMFKKCMHPLVINLYKVIGPFAFGAAANQGTTDIIKYSIGRLRPHFLAACKPDYTTFECTKDNLMQYITDDVCTGDIHAIEEARLSHPSGHSSFSAYAMVFLALYLQSRMTWKGSRLLRHCIQVICMYLTIYTCASRVSDYRHHWSDVVPGFFLGSAVAIITVLYVSTMFDPGYWKTMSQKITEIHRKFSKNSDRVENSSAEDGRERQDQHLHVV